MTTDTPLTRYSATNGALASGFVTAELHHVMEHDQTNQTKSALGPIHVARCCCTKEENSPGEEPQYLKPGESLLPDPRSGPVRGTPAFSALQNRCQHF